MGFGSNFCSERQQRVATAGYRKKRVWIYPKKHVQLLWRAMATTSNVCRKETFLINHKTRSPSTLNQCFSDSWWYVIWIDSTSHVWVCVCVCVCEKERKKGRKMEREKERERRSIIWAYSVSLRVVPHMKTITRHTFNLCFKYNKERTCKDDMQWRASTNSTCLSEGHRIGIH